MISRKSNLPKKLIEQVYQDKKTVWLYTNNEEFMNEIARLAPTLYHDIQKNRYSLTKKMQIEHSLSNYLIRKASRTAVFQTLGEISDSTIQNAVIDVAISLKWLYHLQQKIELNQDRGSKLPIVLNPKITEDTRRFSLVHSTDNRNEVKILKSSVIGMIVEKIKSGSIKLYCELFLELKNTLHSEKKTCDIIKKLFQQKVIQSNLRLSMINFDGVRVLERLQQYANTRENQNLEAIKKNFMSIKEYNEFDNEMSIKITKLESEMNRIIPEIQPIILTKYFIGDDEETLDDTEVQFDVFRWMNVLDQDYAFIDMIAKIFIDTFGYYHEIPLKSALDVIYEKYSEDKIFELAINDPDYVSKKKEYSNFLSKIITKAILANEKIDLELYSEDIKKILDNGRTFHVVECDLKMRPIDERYYLPSTAFSFPVGSYTSKFSKINQETAEDKALYEIDYILEYASDIGLSYRNNDTQMKIINLNNINKFREEITLDDIKIGCDQSGIYLKDEVSSQKIIPIYRNLADLNYRREHFLARFLVLFGKYKYLPPINFNIENYLSFIFIPQIMNGRVIVSKAMWNIKNNYKEKGDLVNIIREYQLKYRLPNIVAILEKGEEYPVFLNTELGISILHKYLRKNTYVTLVEYLELESKSKYIKEYIFNIKCKGIQYDTSLSPCIQTNQKIISNKYISWVIILKQNTNKILKYLDWFCQENNIAFFFVRYNDHNSKSLRFRTRNSLDQNRFIQEVLDNLRIEGEISYYYISDYTPEYNRYGEGDLIDRAEGIFEADSNLAIKLIQYTEKNEFDFGVYIIIDTIFFGMEDLTEGFRLFEKNCIDSEKTKSIRDSYKKNRKYFLELFNRINRKIETSHPEIKTIRLNIKIYFTELKKQYCDEIFWYMVKSFMHMRLNRYIGVKTYENDLLFISKYIIKNMYNTQKFKRGKVDEG